MSGGSPSPKEEVAIRRKSYLVVVERVVAVMVAAETAVAAMVEGDGGGGEGGGDGGGGQARPRAQAQAARFQIQAQRECSSEGGPGAGHSRRPHQVRAESCGTTRTARSTCGAHFSLSVSSAPTELPSLMSTIWKRW